MFNKSTGPTAIVLCVFTGVQGPGVFSLKLVFILKKIYIFET